MWGPSLEGTRQLIDDRLTYGDAALPERFEKEHDGTKGTYDASIDIV